MVFVSVLARSVEKVLDGAFDSGLGVPGFGVDFSIFGAWVVGAGAGSGAGFGPPMLREIVGGGGGASVCSGRSNGAGGGVCGWAGGAKERPGTKVKALALSLLMMSLRKAKVQSKSNQFFLSTRLLD